MNKMCNTTKEVQELILIYNSLMSIFKDNKNTYTILLDYQANKLMFQMSDDKDFNITKYASCNKVMAAEAIDSIRNNFILNHDITLPQIGPQGIKFPDMNFYSYIMCHHLKNTKFDLIITARTKDDEERMEIAQEKAMQKHNKQMSLLKKD